jgi:hypothetical protein
VLFLDAATNPFYKFAKLSAFTALVGVLLSFSIRTMDESLKKVLKI